MTDRPVGKLEVTGGKSDRREGALRRILLALGIGAVGGVFFNWLTMPLPWMLGAIVFNTGAAILRVPIAAPVAVRPLVVVVIGVMLGSSFTSEIFAQAEAWLLSLAFLLIYLVVAGVLTVPYYRRMGGFDPVTAYFAGMPGGMNEMMLIGKEMGGDDRKIVLAHASRIVVLVCLIAVWVRLIAGYELGDRSSVGVPFTEISWVELFVLAACGVTGYFLGPLLRVPAPALLGSMLVSALAHLAGATTLPPPSELVIIAQLFLGTIVGCRFVDATARDIGHAILLSLGATLITFCVSLLFAVLFHGLFGQTVEQVLLAYAPGGVTEMSLVALAMNAEVAYVATHHIFRITLVIALAPLVFAVLRRLGSRL